MESIETKEKIWKKLNIVIMWFGELWQWFYDMLKETNSNVYVVSVSWKNSEQYKNAWIKPYNRYEWFPIKYENIDAVLLCCRTWQLDLVKQLIPQEVLPKVVDKFISFQNGFDVKENLIRIFGKSVSRCVPYLSFKNYDWKTIKLSFARTSPIKWTEQKNIYDLMETLNDYSSKNFGKYLFEWVDSIALQREGEFKAMINTVLNSLCVVYKSDVNNSINLFKQEFGEDAIKMRSKEISDVENVVYDNSPFEINTWEVEYRILHVAEKFAKEKPSTYQQYYINSWARWEVMTEDNHLLWYIIKKAREHKIDVPISKEIWKRMKDIEKGINQTLRN
jgi:ketopantoate reductase